MPDDRRYDDREVGLILKRVAELHEREGDKPDTRSMTRAEIEQVVTELGISKALVARAVSDVAVRERRNRSVWRLGGKTDLMFEQTVDGSVDDATLTTMLEVLRRSLGDPGKLQTQGASRIWSTTGGSRQIHFSVVEHEGKTTLRLEEGMSMTARTTVGFPTGAGAFLGFMSIVPLKALVVKAVLLLAAAPFAAAGAAVGWLVGRGMWRRRSTDREQQLHEAFGEILVLAAGRARALPEPSTNDT